MYRNCKDTEQAVMTPIDFITDLYIDSFRSDNKNIFSLLSRKDIADFAGTSTESAIKLLKSFEKDKLISLKEKDIIIKNRTKLVDISKKG